MKKILIAVLLSLLSIVMVPYAITLWLQAKYYQNINYWNANSALEISGKFKPGIFTSTATTIVKVVTLNKKHVQAVVELEHNIANGPVIFDLANKRIKAGKLAIIETKIINQKFQQITQALYNKQTGIIITTKLEYNGNGWTTIKNLPFTMNLANGQIIWDGAELNLKHNHKPVFSWLEFAMTIPKLSYQEGNNIVEFSHITGFAQQTATAVNSYQELANIKVKQVSLKTTAQEILTLTNWQLQNIVNKVNKFINIHLAVKLDSIDTVAAASQAGPLTFSLKINNINSEAVEQLRQLNSKNIQKQTVVTASTKILVALFESPIAITIENTAFNLAQGKLAIKAKINLGGEKLTTITGVTLLQATKGMLEIAISKTLAYELIAKKIEHDMLLETRDFELLHEGKQMPKPYKLSLVGKQAELENRVIMEINKLIAKKYLQAKAQNFYTTIEFQGDNIKINGKQLLLK